MNLMKEMSHSKVYHHFLKRLLDNLRYCSGVITCYEDFVFYELFTSK